MNCEPNIYRTSILTQEAEMIKFFGVCSVQGNCETSNRISQACAWLVSTERHNEMGSLLMGAEAEGRVNQTGSTSYPTSFALPGGTSLLYLRLSRAQSKLLIDRLL